MYKSFSLRLFFKVAYFLVTFYHFCSKQMFPKTKVFLRIILQITLLGS